MNTLFEHLLPRIAERFRGITRTNGQPYITHPLEAMASLPTLPEKLLVLLHDYAEIADLHELDGLGIPEKILNGARLLAKSFDGEARAPGQTKQLADSNFSAEARQAWDNGRAKFEVTAMMLNAKYAPGTAMRQALQETRHLELIHESKHDKLWGATRKGEGLNVLGKTLILMRERNGNCCADAILTFAGKTTVSNGKA